MDTILELERAHEVAKVGVIPPYVVDLEAERTAQDLDLTFLMVCASCNDNKDLQREWGGKRMLCPKCRENAEIRRQEYEAEERYALHCARNLSRVR